MRTDNQKNPEPSRDEDREKLKNPDHQGLRTENNIRQPQEPRAPCCRRATRKQKTNLGTSWGWLVVPAAAGVVGCGSCEGLW